MGKVILQTLQASDSQKTYSDKANYNFHLLADYINGVKTIKGDKGNVGMPGATGRQGIQGERGNSLFVYESEFPSPDEGTYEDLKEKYISWCDENGITDGDLVIFMDKEAIYKSGVNNEEKVPDIKKDLVVDLSKIISDFVEEKTKGTEFWDRIDKDRDVITLKQYLDPKYKANGNDEVATIVLAPELIKDENGDLKSLVVNNVATAPLNIFSTVIGGGDIEDIYNQQSGISLNSIRVLDDNNYKVEDKDREFRITQRSVRVDNNQTDYVEGLFVVAPPIGSIQKEGLTSGFRFISQKAQNSGSDFKKNNIVTIGDGKFTNGMLMNGYGGDNVENAITFARGDAFPTSDDQYGGYFSIGTEYDNNTVKGFIRTESTVGTKKGDLVIGGYDKFLTFSYDENHNNIIANSIFNIEAQDSLYIKSNGGILQISTNDGKDISIFNNANNGLFIESSNILLTNGIGGVIIQKVGNSITSFLKSNTNSYISVTDGTIEQSLSGKRSHIIFNNNNLKLKITSSSTNEDYESCFFINNLSNYVKTNQEEEIYYYNNKSYKGGKVLIQPAKRSFSISKSLELLTFNKRIEIYNVFGEDSLSLMFPHFNNYNAKDSNDSYWSKEVTTVEKEQYSGSLQFKVPVIAPSEGFLTYDNEWNDNEKWTSGYLGNIGAYTIKGKDFKKVYVNGETIKILPIGSYGIGINSATDLKLSAQGNISANADSIDFNAKTINIGDSNTTVNIGGIVMNEGIIRGYSYDKDEKIAKYSNPLLTNTLSMSGAIAQSMSFLWSKFNSDEVQTFKKGNPTLFYDSVNKYITIYFDSDVISSRLYHKSGWNINESARYVYAILYKLNCFDNNVKENFDQFEIGLGDRDQGGSGWLPINCYYNKNKQNIKKSFNLDSLTGEVVIPSGYFCMIIHLRHQYEFRKNYTEHSGIYNNQFKTTLSLKN